MKINIFPVILHTPAKYEMNNKKNCKLNSHVMNTYHKQLKFTYYKLKLEPQKTCKNCQ